VLNAIPATAGSVSTSYLVDGSVTQVKLATGVAGNGPAFSYYQSSAQTLSAATFTKITLTASLFDTNSCFASSRFTPTVSGYYQFNGTVTVNGSSQEIISALYRNGGAYYYSNDPLSSYQAGVSGIIYCNGSTDYVELYGFFSSGGNTNASQVRTNFSGAMVRSA
jgi:hypothetical protein